MSQATATHPARRPARRRPAAPSRSRLRVVQGRAAARRGWFPLVCVSLLAGGLLAVLVLNAALAQGSFELGRLQASSSELVDQQESLTQSINEQRAPEHLAGRARALGMVPATSAAFLRLSDGKVLGVAEPATADDGFTVMSTTPGNGAASPGTAPPSGPPGQSPDGEKDPKKDEKRDAKKGDKDAKKADKQAGETNDQTRNGARQDDERAAADTSGTDSTSGTDGTTQGSTNRSPDGGATNSTTEAP